MAVFIGGNTSQLGVLQIAMNESHLFAWEKVGLHVMSFDYLNKLLGQFPVKIYF
jgi:hypothetical protein